MSLADLVAAVLFSGVIVYAVFGGADFGSGIWDLTAGGDRRGAPLRRRIDASIGPVWEANHVWLVFVIVFGWTAFPAAFAAVLSTCAVPLGLATVGIVLRGAGFAFRKFSADLAQARLFGAVFATSSLITPFFLGTVAGAVASGRVGLDGGDRWSAWTGPTSLLGGTLAVLTVAFTSAALLAADADRAGEAAVADAFRRRALASGLVAGLVAVAGIAPLRADAPTLADGLVGRGLVEVAVSAVAGLSALGALYRRRYRVARVAAIAAVVTVVAGWGFGQYPWFLVDEVTIAEAAAPASTLWALVVTALLALVVVVPLLVWLLRLVDTGTLDSHA
ncbi:MAG: cytochrome d ubiquinol oxidase subunit II [Actinomyces sp.]|nr:MAG: cytochrome d ubiquinol oxidase subunit II [Actinomyces sp.]